MLADAEKYKAQDEEVRKKVEMAREMDELAYIIDDKGTVDQRRDAEELMAWLTENMANLSISDLSKKQIELKKIVSKCR